jgi:hypothetical protein
LPIGPDDARDEPGLSSKSRISPWSRSTHENVPGSMRWKAQAKGCSRTSEMGQFRLKLWGCAYRSVSAFARKRSGRYGRAKWRERLATTRMLSCLTAQANQTTRSRQLTLTTQRKITGSSARRQRWPCILNKTQQPGRATFRQTPPMSAYRPIPTRA